MLVTFSSKQTRLAVPGKFTIFTKNAARKQKLKEEMTHVKELGKHMDREITEGRETILLC